MGQTPSCMPDSAENSCRMNEKKVVAMLHSACCALSRPRTGRLGFLVRQDEAEERLMLTFCASSASLDLGAATCEQ